MRIFRVLLHDDVLMRIKCNVLVRLRDDGADSVAPLVALDVVERRVVGDDCQREGGKKAAMSELKERNERTRKRRRETDARSSNALDATSNRPHPFTLSISHGVVVVPCSL